MAGWDTFKGMFDYEFTQSLEEGKDPREIDAIRKEADAAAGDEEKLGVLWRRLIALPVRKDFPFAEPNDLEAIRAARPAATRSKKLPYGDDELYDRLYGAWLGRSAGCALGKPVEGFMGTHNGLSSKDRIKTYLTAISPSEYPINNYIPAHSPAEEKTGKVGCPLSLRENIKFMESDDDIRYTVIGQKVFREVGPKFTTFDMMRMWIGNLPYGMVCTAETQAYRNFVVRYQTHMQMWRNPAEWNQRIDWLWVASNENSYREWIGAQIRADHFGYAAPGNMELAADFAWRDARMSHVKNGIYGEMLCAAMIAAAFISDDPLEIVNAGLAEIPATSRLYAEMKQVIEICRKYEYSAASFEAVLDEIYKLLGHYNAVHTNNNAAIVVASLLLGRHDLEKVISISVMGGWDSDCNGATAGSIMGCALGTRGIPAHWVQPFQDTVRTDLLGMPTLKISDLAERTFQVARSNCRYAR